MLRPGYRQASVGEESLLVPDHPGQDSGRPNEEPPASSSEAHGVRFSNVRPNMSESRGSSNRSGMGSRYSTSQNSMGNLDHFEFSLDDAKPLGAIAAFRSAAAARKWINSTRRSVLRNRQIRDSEAAAAASTSELSPLNNQSRGSSNDVSDENGEGETSPKYNTLEAFRSIIFGKAVSVLLLLIPFAIWSTKAGWGAQYIFWLNFLVMIPLASILGDFTEEAALHTNDTIGGLLNATFGNAVEVVVAIQALLANEIRVVQASMIGSIFSNLLLVLGCCFFFGGLYHKEQTFNSTTATANMGLLALSSIAMVLPTPFAEYYNIQDEHVLIISRFAAIFLLFMYIQLLVFQLYTHKDVFDEVEESKTETDENAEEEAEQEEEASISMSVALIGLAITTLAVTIFSDHLVESIDEFCEVSGISRTFVGLIILPIVGNAVEHITAVTVAMKDKMDLSMGVTVGSCTQISLFVVPLTVLVGWAFGKPMTLNFPHFEIILYILSIFTVSVCISNPKGNWLEGSLLITTYIMIAIGFWFEKVLDFR